MTDLDSAVTEDDVRERVPAHLLDQIADLTRLAESVDSLAQELGRRWRDVYDAYQSDADWRRGDDWDCDLAEAAGLSRLEATLGAIRARLDDGMGDAAEGFLTEHGFTGIGITEGQR